MRYVVALNRRLSKQDLRQLVSPNTRKWSDKVKQKVKLSARKAVGSFHF